eukprot:11452538-Ditylum_brightwellii.AAC.1
MTNNGKHVKWHNSIQNHQNDEPLPEMHRKDKFLLFTEKGKRIKIKTFPAKAAEVYGLFDYIVCEKGYKNVLLILHAMAPMSFYNFKTPATA